MQYGYGFMGYYVTVYVAVCHRRCARVSPMAAARNEIEIMQKMSVRDRVSTFIATVPVRSGTASASAYQA